MPLTNAYLTIFVPRPSPCYSPDARCQLMWTRRSDVAVVTEVDLCELPALEWDLRPPDLFAFDFGSLTTSLQPFGQPGALVQ